jgi:hypothetical protein
MGRACVDRLAIAIMFPNGRWASVCRWPFLLELGRIFYCLYVIRQAANLMCHEFLLEASSRFMDGRSIGVTILAVALAYGPARLSWVFFRVPAAPARPRYHTSRGPVSSAGSEHDPSLRNSV